jgi:hypothetical protein
MRSGTLGEALGLTDADDVVVAYRDQRHGLEHVRRSRDLRADGLWLALDAYSTHVFLDVREIHDPAGVWRHIADRLGGSGVPSLADALRELQFEPVHEALRAALDPDVVRPILAAFDRGDRTDGATDDDAARTGPGSLPDEPAEASEAAEVPGAAPATDDATSHGLDSLPAATIEAIDELGRRTASFLVAVASVTGADGDPAAAARRTRVVIQRALGRRPFLEPPGEALTSLESRLTLVALAVLDAIGGLDRGGAVTADRDARLAARTGYAELRLDGVVAGIASRFGLEEGAAWQVAGRLGWLVGMAPLAGVARAGDIVRDWFEDPALRSMLHVNRWQDAEYFERDALDELVGWSLALAEPAAEEDAAAAAAAAVADIAGLPDVAEAAGYRVDRLLALAAGTAEDADVPDAGDAGTTGTPPDG